MKFSANLNIITKSIEKATFKMGRDFSELESLQQNQASATKFTNACYKKIKDILTEDLTKMRPNYNIFFSDGSEVINDKNAEYSFVIHAIDGLNNLSRSISDFTISIALQHHNQGGLKESIALAINKIMASELYYCEKGFGAFLNNRKIRTSKRNAQDSVIIACEDNLLVEKYKEKLVIKNLAIRNYGCKTLEIAYLASAKIDLCLFKNNNEFLKPFFLLALEAGGKIDAENNLTLIKNSII